MDVPRALSRPSWDWLAKADQDHAISGEVPTTMRTLLDFQDLSGTTKFLRILLFCGAQMTCPRFLYQPE